MESYIGKICPFCKKRITKNESVKICPACGIPHHERCWEKNNGCATQDCSENVHCASADQNIENSENDSTPISDENVESEASLEKRFCSNCGAELAENQNYCPTCGRKTEIAAGNKQAGKKKMLFVILAAAVVVGIGLFFCLSGGNRKDFRDMYGDLESNAWCSIAADGSYLKLDTNPYNVDDEDQGLYFHMTYSFPANDAIERINKELGFSDALMEKMNTTTWSQGRQNESNDKYSVTWTYHPDKGMEVLYEMKK